jgi:hypothetical protein
MIFGLSLRARIANAGFAILAMAACTAPAASAQTPTSESRHRGMIKFAAIWEQPNENATLDDWYRTTHSRESLLFVGPWLRRYWAYRALDVPAEADAFNVVRYRLTEMWYDSVEARRESAPVFYPLTPPPTDRVRYPNRTRIANIYVEAVPSERYIDGWPRDRPSYTRWVFFYRYPREVAISQGERWFTSVHAPELARLPALRRFVCHTAAEAPAPGAWARMCELWFDDYGAWKQALLTVPPALTSPPWSRDASQVPMISTFTAPTPDMDFMRDGGGVP